MVGAERLTQRPIEEQLKKAVIKEITLKDGRVLQGFAITQTFWRTVKEEGVLEELLGSLPNDTLRQTWQIYLKATDAYIEDPEITFEDCVKVLGKNKRQSGEYFVEKTLESVWMRSSEDTQLQFPLAALRQRKPIPIKVRERISQSQGGEFNRVSELIRDGKTRAEIKAIGFTLNQAAYAQRKLKSQGFDIPHKFITPAKFKELAEDLKDVNKTSKERQEKLDNITPRVRIHLLREGAIVSLRDFVLDEGHLNPRSLKDIAEFLGENEVPVGRLTTEIKSGPKKGEHSYYFLAHGDYKKAQDTLRNYPNNSTN